MIRILLDTHTLLWTLMARKRLDGCRLASRDGRLDAYGTVRLWD